MTAEPLSSRGAEGLPGDFAPNRLLRRLLQVLALLAAIARSTNDFTPWEGRPAGGASG